MAAQIFNNLKKRTPSRIDGWVHKLFYTSPGVIPYLFLKASIKWLALVYPTIHTTSFTLYFPLCNKRCAISMRFSTMYS